MRRLARAGIVAAVAVLVVAAAVDALRADDEKEPGRARASDELVSTALRARTAAALERAGVSGTLLFAGEDCRVRGLALPGLRAVAVDRPPICGAPLVERRLAGTCRLGVGEQLATSAASLSALTASCAPWVFRALRRALGRRCTAAEVDAIAFAPGAKAAAIVRCPRRLGADEKLLALFRNRRLVGGAGRSYSRLAGLRTSPQGTYVAVRANGTLLLLASGGAPVMLPARRASARAITWSPDERWAALATRGALYLFRTGRHPRGVHRGVHRLPLPASDVGWLASR